MEPDDVLEQARQKMVEIVQLMMRYMDGRSRDEGQLFRGLVERQVPGMPAMIDQSGTTAQIATRINDFQKPGWEGRLTEAFGRMSTQHPVFADPAVRAASNQYLAMQPRMQERLTALTNEMRDLGAPGSAATYRRLGQEAGRRATAPGPLRPTGPAPRSAAGQATPPPPGAQPQPQPRQAPGGAQPTPPQPTQTPGPGTSPTPPTSTQPTQSPTAHPQAGPTQAAGTGTQRTQLAATSGPVALDAKILQGAGKITVRADPSCTRAEVTIRTTDTDGPSADAVRASRREATPDGRMTMSAASDGTSTAVISRTSNGVVQNIRTSGNGSVMMAGSIGELNIDGRSITMGNVRNSTFTISGNDGPIQIGDVQGDATVVISRGSAPIEIDARVPEGSTVVARTETANIEAHGNLEWVNARSISGAVSCGSADRTDGTGMPGSAALAEVHSVKGPVTVHADRACDVRAGSVESTARVTASSPEVGAQMRADADGINGTGDVPPESRRFGSEAGTRSPRADGARDNHTARQTQNHQAGTGLGG